MLPYNFFNQSKRFFMNNFSVRFPNIIHALTQTEWVLIVIIQKYINLFHMLHNTYLSLCLTPKLPDCEQILQLIYIKSRSVLRLVYLPFISACSCLLYGMRHKSQCTILNINFATCSLLRIVKRYDSTSLT